MANLNQLSCTRLIISNTDKTTLRNTETSPDTRARTPHKGTASRDPQLNCPEISENYPPTIILANKKQRKVPVLHAVSDKNKKNKIISNTQSQLVECRFCKFCKDILLVSKILSHF